MKAIKSVLISLAMCILFVNAAMANNYSSEIKVEDKKLHLLLENVSGQTTLSILDTAGAALIEEKVIASGLFEHVFDLGNLPLGSYALTIKSSFKETSQEIEITREALLIDESVRTKYFPAIISPKRGKLKLSLMNPTNNMVRIFVLDNAGRICFQDAINDQMVIERNFNLRQLPSGKYTVVVENADEVYTKNVKLR